MTADHYDLIIIGAGLGGTCAAHALASAGRRVALIDAHAVYPPDFRAEKLGEPEMAQFDRLGLGRVARAACTPVEAVTVVRMGGLTTTAAAREYGVHYTDLVNRLRQSLPPQAPLIVARVADIATGPGLQTVTLSDGRRLTARLVVLATGLGDALRRKVGIGKVVLSERHSLCFGFTLAAAPAAFPFESLTYYADRPSARAAYVTLFPLGASMRANLFVYRDPGEEWAKAFRTSPDASLRALFPGLARLCPDLSVASRIEMRPIDLVAADAPARDGVVLIGDACLTPCPITGTGVGKALTDVERLCAAYLPRWLETEGMGVDKIAAFYADPAKRAADAECLRSSLYSRAIATDPGPVWAMRRLRNRIGRHALHRLDALRRRSIAPRKGPRLPGDDDAATRRSTWSLAREATKACLVGQWGRATRPVPIRDDRLRGLSASSAAPGPSRR